MNKKHNPLSYKLGTFCAYLIVAITTVIGVTGTIAILKYLIDFIHSYNTAPATVGAFPYLYIIGNMTEVVRDHRGRIISGVCNPTGKGGFQERPQDRGSWTKDTSPTRWMREFS